ncbi:LisH domain-containing protein armc9 [Phlyctochytrium bullatum]|nr:LisH domain-containing protein armc9 [Phlyctochytrium bullatum]
MEAFKHFLGTGGADLCKTTQFLSFYALPYVPDPKVHPSFGELFAERYLSELEDRFWHFLTMALEAVAKRNGAGNAVPSKPTAHEKTAMDYERLKQDLASGGSVGGGEGLARLQTLVLQALRFHLPEFGVSCSGPPCSCGTKIAHRAEMPNNTRQEQKGRLESVKQDASPMKPSSVPHGVASVGVLLLSTLIALPVAQAQCVQDISALSSLITTSPATLTASSCEASCASASYAFYGLQFTNHFSTTGMSGCSTYEGSTCFCARSLSGGNITSNIGFSGFSDGNCGDCNTKLVCGASQGVDNPSPFVGMTCGVRYIYTYRDSTTINSNSAFFNRVAVVSPVSTSSVPTSSQQPTSSRNPAETSGGTQTNPPTETVNRSQTSPTDTVSSTQTNSTAETVSRTQTNPSDVSSSGIATLSTAGPGSVFISVGTTNIQQDNNKGLAGSQLATSTASALDSSGGISGGGISGGGISGGRSSGGGSSGVPLGLIVGLGVAGAVVVTAVAALVVYRMRNAKTRKDPKGPLALPPSTQPPAQPAPPTEPFQPSQSTSPIPTNAIRPAFLPFPAHPVDPSAAAATSGSSTLAMSPPSVLAPVAPPLPTKHADTLFDLPAAPLRTASLRADAPVVAKLDKTGDHKAAGTDDIKLLFEKRAGALPMNNTRGPAGWGWEEVRAWLEERGYGDCVDRFKAVNATGALLQRLHANPVLANELLRTELGVAAMDQRLRFVEELQRLFGVQESADAVGIGRGVTVEAPPPYVRG